MIGKHVYERGLMNSMFFSRIRAWTLLSILFASLLIAVFALLSGCGKKNEEKAEGSRTYKREYFADWLKHRSQIFELRYPPKEDLEQRAPAIGEKCDQIVALLSQMLRMRPPHTIYIMIFDNKFDAEKMLGRKIPYVSNDTIFYDILSPLGAPITELMMKRAAPEGSKYAFINEGFPTLLDFSGQNYHANVLQQVENGTSFPIDSLVNNDAYQRMPYEQRREEAASFIGFLTKTYGSAPLLGFLKQDMSPNGILMMSTKRSLAVIADEWRLNLPKLAEPDSALIKAQQQQPEQSDSNGGE